MHVCVKTMIMVHLSSRTCLFLTRPGDRLVEAASLLRSAIISRERPLAEVPGRCDAVAVGLIDRKHVGVVGANRDAAAAKGDREYLHPVHISAPLKPQGFPRRYVCLRCAEQLLSLLLFFFKHPFETKGAPNGCKPCSPARYLHIVFDLAYNQRHLDEAAGTTRTVVAMESTLSRLKPRL